MPTMAAAVASAPGRIECREAAIPEPQEGKALIKMKLASICGSDMHIVYMGWNVEGWPLPAGYPGHEGIAEIVEATTTGFEPGQLVLSVPNIWQSKNFAGYQLIDPAFLLPLPDGKPLAHLLMAQQLGTVLFAARKLPPLQGKTVAILGQGSAGLFHDYCLRRLGAERIIAVEPVAARLAAGRRYGVDEAIDVSGQQAIDAVFDLTHGEGADVVVEAAGTPQTLNAALGMVKHWGYVHAFGFPAGPQPIAFDFDTFVRRRVTMGSIFGAQDEAGLASFQAALDLIVNDEIDVTPLLTHELPLAEVGEAFQLARERADGAIKVTLNIDGA